jgi:hypothetical protein
LKNCSDNRLQVQPAAWLSVPQPVFLYKVVFTDENLPHSHQKSVRFLRQFFYFILDFTRPRT